MRGRYLTAPNATMRSSRLLSLLMLAALLVLVPALALVSYHGHKVYRMVPREDQMQAMAELRERPDLDFWSTVIRAGSPVDVRVPPEVHDHFERVLDRNGVQHEVLIDDLEDTFQRERQLMLVRSFFRSPDSPISFSTYHDYRDIQQYLSQLAERYPKTVRLQTIGTTYEGRPIEMIQISSGGDGKRPVILIDAGIHGREWIAPAAALYIINQLVENPDESSLTDKVDWHIIPVLNPDGYHYSFTTDRMWRKTRSKTRSVYCKGVDPNRNFGFHWNQVGAMKSPCSITYAGGKAFSEHETQALRDYVLANAKRIKLYITLHSYGPFILYPWGYTTALPSDWRTLDTLARKANDAQAAAGGPKYEIGSSTNALYAAAGGSDDWVKGVAGVALAYTIELPGGGSMGFNPPASDILKLVKPFFELVRVYGEYIADNYG